MSTFERLRELIKAAKPELDINALSRSDSLKNDLGMDSLDITMLTIVVEDEFNLYVSNELTLSTVGDLCDYIDDVRCIF